MKSNIQTMEQASLMAIVLLIPNAFKDFLIMGNDDVEDFDIGLKELWLKTKIDEINVAKRWSVFKEKPSEEDGCIISHYDCFYIQKCKNLNGGIEEKLCYKQRILLNLSNNNN